MNIGAFDSTRTDPTRTDSAPPKGAGSTALGKEEFLKLLVTQMQHQDPLSPTDNAAFTAQLAQFSSLEQLFQVNKGIDGLAASQAPSGMASVAGFLGRDVTAQGDAVILGDNGASPIQFSLDAATEITNVAIRDESGQTVRTFALGALPGGSNQGVWDGLDDQGQALPPGTYHFSVAAQDNAGDSVATHTRVRGRVTGAEYQDGTPILIVGARRVPLTDVTAVTVATTTGP